MKAILMFNGERFREVNGDVSPTAQVIRLDRFPAPLFFIRTQKRTWDNRVVFEHE